MATDYLTLINDASSFLNLLENDDPALVLDVNSREIQIPENFNTEIAIKNDFNSEKIVFICDKRIEGYDIYNGLIENTSMKAFIKWEKNFSEVGIYEISEVIEYSQDLDKMELSWVLDKEATEKEGKLRFSINFYQYSNDGSDVNIIYCWQSKICDSLSIGQAIEVLDIDDSKTLPVPEYDFSGVPTSSHSGLTDSNEPLVLNLSTRDIITSQENLPLIGCSGDCASSALTFKFEGETDFGVENFHKFVKWRVGEITGFDEIFVDSETGLNTWVMSPLVTEQSGKLEFQLLCLSSDKTGEIIRRWHSKICSFYYIEDSIYCAEIDKEPIIPDFGEYDVEIKTDEDGTTWLYIGNQES